MARAEASEDQRRAFANALVAHLAGRSLAWLGTQVGVSRQAVAEWADSATLTEPTRSNVFAAERALGIPPGALSSLLGYLPLEARIDAASAITLDTALSDHQRAVVLDAYAAARDRVDRSNVPPTMPRSSRR